MDVREQFSDHMARDLGILPSAPRTSFPQPTQPVGRRVTFTLDQWKHEQAIVPLEPTGFAIVTKRHWDWLLEQGFGERWTYEVPFDDFVPMVCAPDAEGRPASVTKVLQAQGWLFAVVKV